MRKQYLCGLALVLLVAVMGGACGGSETSAPESGSTPALTATPRADSMGPTATATAMDTSGSSEPSEPETGSTPATGSGRDPQGSKPTNAPAATEDSSETMPATARTESMVSQFASVSAGSFHTCWVRADGSVACWGDDRYGRATPPDGEFASVSAGRLHTCGLRVDGSVACWGADGEGRATPPDGEFASVSAGGDHTCGVRADGSVACWGDDRYGRTAAPGGEFASVGPGILHTCGVRVDGSVACWGDDRYGRTAAPGGEFALVSAGERHTCGERADGSVACWGNDDYGQSTTPRPDETEAKGEASDLAVAEYAAWCGKRAVDTTAPETWGEAIRQLDRTLDDYESVTAPEELQAVHSALITLLKAQLDLYQSQDGSEPYDEFLFGQQPDVLKVITPLFIAIDALDEEIVSQLEDSGCLTTDDGS